VKNYQDNTQLKMDSLPDEMLQQVFVELGHPSHLPAVALVCR
jgi:hypothetical protein